MSTLSVGTIQSNTTSPPVFNNSSGVEIGELCRAWVNFNGTGVVAIRASFNVSSITDTNTGRYVVNLANALPDANYAVAISGNMTSGVDNTGLDSFQSSTTSAVNITMLNTAGAYTDYFQVAVSIFR